MSRPVFPFRHAYSDGSAQSQSQLSTKFFSLFTPQIAPFHVELSVRETGLDFTKLRSAAVSLFTTKRPRDLIALNSNNAFLEFLLEGSPEVKINRTLIFLLSRLINRHHVK